MRKATNRALKIKIIVLLIAVSTILFCITKVYSSDPLREMHIRDFKSCNTNPLVINSKKIGDYNVIIYQADDWMCQGLKIQRLGNIIYSETEIDAHYFLGATWGDEDSQELIRLSGSPSPELVVSKWTGGAHCCFSLLIFEIGNEFRKIATIEGGNFQPRFEDVDGDGVSEVKVGDDFLAYHFSSFASSAIADVTLKYTAGQYEVSVEHMLRLPTDWVTLAKKIPGWQKELRNSGNPDYPPPSFIQTITDLVFSGNKVIALQLLDYTWPMGLPGKNEFWSSYEEALRNSRYYGELEMRL
jgi:hypothetical protein